MKPSELLCAFMIVFAPSNVVCFEFIKDYFFPRSPMVTRVGKAEQLRSSDDEFAVLNTVGLVEQHGYGCREHKITTVDGYRINFFQIYSSPLSPEREGKRVIFLQHGVLTSSDSWVLFGPGKDLAFLLADNGYDVWLGNIRGNSYGRAHAHISTLEEDFWKFSFHESATRDISKMIDYILKYTSQKKLSYIGHSMGTTMIFVLLSEIPEYNEKMSLVICLAPVAIWKKPPTWISNISPEVIHFIKRFLEENKIYELIPQTRNKVRLGRALCSDSSVTQLACKILISQFAGDDPDQLNSTVLPYIFSYYPAGSSTMTLNHYYQNIESGNFQKYDYGYIENFRLYGKKKPPVYDLNEITAPIALIYGLNDAISLETNIEELARRLQNVVTLEAVKRDKFNHIDFQWGTNSKNLLYDRVIELLATYR